MKISTIIIDDEPLARNRLERFVEATDGAELLAVGSSGTQAIDLVKEHRPDVLLLDIEMPGMNGIEAAKIILNEVAKPPAIIFCTAYSHYALEAFSTSAVGYLMKPVSFEKLNEQFLRAQRLTRLQIHRLQDGSEDRNAINVSQSGYLARLPVSDILYFRSEGKAVVAGLADKEIVVAYSLKLLLDKISDDFIRIHRNTLVNKKYLARLEKNSEGLEVVHLREIEMTFVVSRRHLPEVRKCFK